MALEWSRSGRHVKSSPAKLTRKDNRTLLLTLGRYRELIAALPPVGHAYFIMLCMKHLLPFLDEKNDATLALTAIESALDRLAFPFDSSVRKTISQAAKRWADDSSFVINADSPDVVGSHYSWLAREILKKDHLSAAVNASTQTYQAVASILDRESIEIVLNVASNICRPTSS
jgi:hypothetical protein